MSFNHKGRQIQRSTGTFNKKLAEAILGKLRTKIIEGKYFDILEEKERTFEELMDRYLREVSVTKAAKSQVRDKNCLNHLLPFFEGMTLAEVTPKVLSSYKAKRREEKAAPATTNRELGLVKHAFNVAIKEWEWCRENPVCRISMEKVNNVRVRYLTDVEFAKILAQCPGWLKPIVLVARYTGIRKENVVSLQWDQVNLSGECIYLEHTKNGDRLMLPLRAVLVDLFKALARVRHIRSPYVFLHSNGQPYRGDVVYKGFVGVCNKAGISNFTFHDLRHTFASDLVQSGIDLYIVQKLLGHRDGRMTQRYAHLAPENLKQAIRSLDQKYDNSMTVGSSEQKASNTSA